MYQVGGTLREILSDIEQTRYVLPAIQREFVWSPDQICKLFDSLMQGYPFGAFLFWRVEPAQVKNYKFYGFVRDYHERDNPHCPDLGPMSDRELVAVLDGQQRLTAMNIGLRGSMAVKRPNMWRTNPLAYPKRYLHLNLLGEGEVGEEGQAFEFSFREAPNGAGELAEEAISNQLWFRVSDILTLPKSADRLAWLHKKGVQGDQQMQAFEILENLYRVVYSEKLISFFEERSQDIERVLNIFIRLNRGGTELTYSDLLLSIATAQWSHRDARNAVYTLVDELNRIGAGFNFSKDFVLKAGLMLADIASVGFKVENLTRLNMEKLEQDWDQIRRTLILTVRLAAGFGLSAQGRWAESSLLPIAYYLYRRNVPENYLTHTSYEADRRAIRDWLIPSLLKASGIWGSGLDTLLTALRATVQSDGAESFPNNQLRQVMAQRGKSLVFGNEEIEELLELTYGDHRTFLMLSLLYPFVDLRNQFHVDHVFPNSRLTPSRLRREGVADSDVDEYTDRANGLPNLQLLEGAINNEKRAVPPREWLEKYFSDLTAREHFSNKYDLGPLPQVVTEFPAFYDARRERMRTRLSEVVNPAT